MKRIITITLLIFFISCNQETKQTAAPAGSTQIASTEDKKALPQYAYPVAMADWTMGNPNHTKMILDLYRAWEQQDSAVFAASFADSATMDLPDKRRITFTNGNAHKKLYAARSQYQSISNKIVSAYALHNGENNADWVMVMVYNKWTYNDGTRDSALYSDNWRLKEGKIVYLNSLEQAPTKTFLKTLETRLE